MNEKQAKAVAGALGGDSWQSGGGVWLVTLHRADGRIIVISDDAICLYADEGAFERGDVAIQSIELHGATVSSSGR